MTSDKDEGEENNSFLDFLDTIKTPENDSGQQGFKTPGIHAACSLMSIIERLVDNDSNLHRLLSDERLLSKQLQSHVSDLKKELQIFKTRCPHPLEVPLLFEDSTSAQIVDKISPSNDDSADQKLKLQLKEIQMRKHQEYTNFKAAKELTSNKVLKDEVPTTYSSQAMKQKWYTDTRYKEQ